MKRGLISWDKSEIAPEVFEQRARRVGRVLAERDLPGLVVYSELWRSNQARFFSNYMPYFNRALLIIPRGLPPPCASPVFPRPRPPVCCGGGLYSYLMRSVGHP